MNDFEPPEPGSYDRVVSVEMFEHSRNYRLLLKRISGWLKPGGKLFVHVFCHKETAYPYVDSGDPNDWMTRHFFAGGMMPSDDLLTRFKMTFENRTAEVALERRRRTPRPARAWLENHGRHAERPPVLAGLWRRRQGLVGSLAHLLHGLRRVLRPQQRRGVVREPLPLCAALAPSTNRARSLGACRSPESKQGSMLERRVKAGCKHDASG